MKSHQVEAESPLDSITRKAMELGQALEANERVQQRFRYAVLGELSKMESMLKCVMGAQCVQFWPPGAVSDERRRELIQELEGRTSKATGEVYWHLVRFIHGASEAAVPRRDGRRKWSGWEI